MKGGWANISTTLYGNWKRLDFLLVKTNVISLRVLFKLTWNSPSPPTLFTRWGRERERRWGTCGFALRGRCGCSVGSALGTEVAGWPAPQSFLVRIWSYTLGVTHTVEPWSQKKLREYGRKLICIFYKPNSKNILLCQHVLPDQRAVEDPWAKASLNSGLLWGWDFSGCHFTTFTTTQNNKKKTGWKITYSTFAGGYFGLALCQELYSYHLTSLSLL